MLPIQMMILCVLDSTTGFNSDDDEDDNLVQWL